MPPGRRALAFLVSLAIVAGATACTSTDDRLPAPGEPVVITTGSARGVYYAWGSAVADELGERADVASTVMTSSGSVENLRRVTSGAATFAISTEDATVGVPGIAALARIYDDYVHVVVRDDGPVRELADLTGRRVAIGPPGSGTAIVADRLLREAGVTAERLPLDVVSGTAALRERKIDAVVWSGGVPTQAVAELAQSVPIHLLSLDAVAAGLRADYGGVYRPATVPAGSYGSKEPVSGIASANLLVTATDTPSPVVAVLLSTIFEQRAALATRVPAARAFDLGTAIYTGNVPLHPAAVSYYRSVKP